MSSFGSGGGSASGSVGGSKLQLGGLDLSSLLRQLGPGQGQGQQQAGYGVPQVGQMARMSPQARFAMAMRQYGGQG